MLDSFYVLVKMWLTSLTVYTNFLNNSEYNSECVGLNIITKKIDRYEDQFQPLIEKKGETSNSN